MARKITLASAVACYVLGGYLLNTREDIGMMFILAGCLGVLSYSTEA